MNHAILLHVSLQLFMICRTILPVLPVRDIADLDYFGNMQKYDIL